MSIRRTDVGQVRVLVIDDERANVRLLARLLGVAGFGNVTGVSDPSEAEQICAASRFDVVILDLHMPGMSGIELLKRLKFQCGDALPSVVVVTADASRRAQLEALSCGASDYLTKPFDGLELVARVRNLAEARLARRLLDSQNEQLEVLVRDRTRELQESRLEIIRLLGRAAESRDNETGQHIMRMSHMSEAIARAVGWSEDDRETLLAASPMHDIGKIGIPDSILLKPGPLTAEERIVMQSHTVKGALILDGEANNAILRMARDIALSHHEKWNGTGYPHGLKHDAIPIAARIVAVADVYDALSSKRPYKEAWESERVLRFIRTNAGEHFDPTLVEAMCDIADVMAEIRDRYADEVVISLQCA